MPLGFLMLGNAMNVLLLSAGGPFRGSADLGITSPEDMNGIRCRRR